MRTAADYAKLFGLTKPERTTAVSEQNAAMASARPEPHANRMASKVRGYAMADGGILFRRGWIRRAEQRDIRLTEQERNRIARENAA